jgi:2,3-bisphosphoglycerate-dependent phosphoglycerate mutase
MSQSDIESYNTNQDKNLKNEKIILNVEGERRAELLCSKDELKNIDAIYTSNCVRTLQTAKYLMYNQNLKANIDDRLDERRVGISNIKEYPDWFERQYFDENFKTTGGESQKEVRERFSEVIDEILEKYKGKRIAVFSHGYAITFYLLNYFKFLGVFDDKLKYEFNGKIAFEKSINAPEVFKLTFEGKELKDLEIVEFDDIPYNMGI